MRTTVFIFRQSGGNLFLSPANHSLDTSGLDMPFNEKGEIIRSKNREKTRSDIQRSVPSNDDDNFGVIIFSGFLPSFVMFFLYSVLVLDREVSFDMLAALLIISLCWPVSVILLYYAYCSFVYLGDLLEHILKLPYHIYYLFNSATDFWPFHWLGCLISIVFYMWVHHCCEEREKLWLWFWSDNDEQPGFLFFISRGILNIFCWPSVLLMSVISLLIHYFRSFMEKVANVGLVCFALAIIYILIGALIGK